MRTTTSSFSLPRHTGQFLAAGAALGGILLAAAAVAGSGEDVARKYFDPDFLSRSRRYHDVAYALFVLQTLAVLGAAWWGALRPPSVLRRLGRGNPWRSRWAVLTAWFLALTVVRLPFRIAAYLHATAYGLRHDPPASFLLDQAKAALVGWVLVSGVGLSLLFLYGRLRRRWWLASGALVAVVAPAYVLVAPLVVDPLFLRFRPLEDAELIAGVRQMAERAGLKVDEVLVADAGRRTRAVNAYFTGLGATRRVVLYDTLLDTFPPREVLVIVAHEMGHWRHRHLLRGLVAGVGATVLGLGLAQAWLARWVRRGLGGVRGRCDPLLVLPAYAIFLTLSLLALPPARAVSRSMEREADREALRLTADREAFVAARVRSARSNLADVLPPAWVERLLATHPSPVQRIRMAEEVP